MACDRRLIGSRGQYGALPLCGQLTGLQTGLGLPLTECHRVGPYGTDDPAKRVLCDHAVRQEGERDEEGESSDCGHGALRRDAQIVTVARDDRVFARGQIVNDTCVVS